MTLRELLVNHDRGFVEQFTRDRARTANVGDAILCRVLGTLNMYVDPLNYDMSPWLALDGYWESWVTMAIGRAIQPGWTCIDVGAWCGYYTAIMANLVGPGGKVVSYEPTPVHSELSKRTTAANGFENVTFSQEAVSDRDGEGAYHLTAGGGSRLVDTDVGGQGGTLKVFTGTLDQHRKADLIKIDIEGGEERAWAGMQRLLTSNPNCIVVMEWEPGRYVDAGKFADGLAAHSPIREITTDGATRQMERAELLEPVMRNLWLQR